MYMALVQSRAGWSYKGRVESRLIQMHFLHFFLPLSALLSFLQLRVYQHGQLTHIHLAADLVTQAEGCADRTNHTHYGHCPCDNCKYEDHGGTTIIALAV
jgi:hypothetical protein